MSRRNGRAHLNKLEPSPHDVVAMCQAVETRFVEVLELHLRVNGEKLYPPAHLDRAMHLWRTMAVRFKKGDFRNTADEKKALREIAEWTLRVNAKLRNQKMPVVDWSGW